MTDSILGDLLNRSQAKILLLVFDGLGGLPRPGTGKTELETARSPHLDRWAAEGATGLVDPVGPGITPGSGPAHLALFGYDPIGENVGRGVLSALGAGLEMTKRDVAARINFATRGADGNLIDRRAGRIPSDEGRRVAGLLADGVRIDGVEITVRAEKEHRAVVVFRGDGLGGDVTDTDPQATGVPARAAEAHVDSPAARRTADVANDFIRQAREILGGEDRANEVLLRGFAGWNPPPSFREKFGLRAAAIAMYPMYRGLASLVGMDVLPEMPSIEAEFEALPKALAEHDFVYLHIKQTDSAGEDGDFDRKVSVIEKVDALLDTVDRAAPDVVMVTGDHSTPSLMKTHSWHPVPLLMRGGHTYVDDTREFGETACRRGALGRFPSRHLMAQALASAGRLDKFGA
ncbi:MAG: 2,3-bisphosphoglycerate-independent phosphoglycerate mutase [Gemmatimonadetes bacterium]|nr:2,3-bisphosphoglycerate-independent phosphoglycerate mutase [Gemmatimonadota bacterium]